jgi:predicted transcriptional regulator of viral defense system
MAHNLPEHLGRLVQIQGGILSAQQAMAGGMTRDMIRARVRNGRWRKLQYGVYATFSGVPARDAVLWAAVLRVGRGAVLSHYTAGELYELIDWPSSAIHVTIPEQRRVTALPGIRLHIAVRAEQAAHPTLLPPRTRVEEAVLDLAGIARTADEACGWITRGLTTQERLR